MDDFRMKNRILTLIMAWIAAFTGIFSFTMMFLQAFLGDSGYYSLFTLICSEVIMSLAMAAFFTFVKKTWVKATVVAGAAAVFFMILGKKLIYGMGIIFNDISECTSDYFGTGLYLIGMTEDMTDSADAGTAVYFIVFIITALYSYCFAEGKLKWMSFILSIISLYPLVMAMGPSGAFTMLSIAYCVMTAIVMMAHGRKKTGHLPALTAAAATGTFMMLSSALAGIICPEDSFKRPQYFEVLNGKASGLIASYEKGELAINKVEQFFIDLFHINVEKKNSSGGKFAGGPSGSGRVNGKGVSNGSLGQVDMLLFSGEQVMSVMTVPVEKTIYLKSFTGMDYAGTRWKEPTDDADYKELDALGVHSQDLMAECLQLMNNDDISISSMKIGADKSSSIQVMPVYPADVYDVSYRSDAGYDITGQDYVRYFSAGEDTIRAVNSLSGAQAPDDFREKELKYRAYAYEKYLDVNTPAKDELADMWGSVSNVTAEDRYNAACAVRDYLAENYRYNPSPGRVPKDRDFIQYFLDESHEGYCTYFATAAVMMLRSAGIPARYVEGYTFDTDHYSEANEVCQVTRNGITADEEAVIIPVKDSDAHAWVEYYVDGAGWMDFEVTPSGTGAEVLETSESYETFTEQTSERDTESPAETVSPSENVTETYSTGDKPSVPENTGTGGNGNGNKRKFTISGKTLRMLTVILSFVSLIGIIAVFLAIRHKIVEKKRDKMYDVSVDGAETDKKVIELYAEYMRLLKCFGYRIKPGETELSFAERVSASLKAGPDSDAKVIAEVYENAVFGAHADSDGYNRMLAAYDALRNRLYGRIGNIKRFIYRYFYNI